jgi:rod shape-determining protein MreD
VLVSALIIQVAVVPHLGVRGYIADAMLMVAAAAGLLLGVERGMAIGFTAGLATDLIVTTPFGLWAAVGLLIGYAGGSLAGSSVPLGPVPRALWTAVLTACGVLAFAALALLLGQSEIRDVALLPTVLMVGISSAFASPIATYALRWAFDLRRLPGEAA